MRTDTLSVADTLKKAAGKEFYDMTDDSFKKLMKDQSSDKLLLIRESLVSLKEFYKKILMEEYRKTHPNSVRYREAEEIIEKINVKGKLLKSIIDNL